MQLYQIMGILGGKGGVGKSCVTVNLALALQAQGNKVGILDADLYGPSIAKMLSCENMPLKDGEKIIPPKAYGISLISMAFLKKEDEPSLMRAPVANQAIEQFLQNVDWEGLDYLLIDFPPGTGDICLTLMQKACLNGVIGVTTPQEVALLDVKKSLEMARMLEVPILGLIENMSYFIDPLSGKKHFIFGQGPVESFAHEKKIPFLGKIPLDPFIASCQDQGLSPFVQNPDHIALIPFKELAQNVQKIAKQTDFSVDIEIKNKHLIVNQKSYRLEDLQKLCPCIKCTTRKNSNPQQFYRSIDPELDATDVICVGRYGVRIKFTKGCSQGIYSFAYLNSLRTSLESLQICFLRLFLQVHSIFFGLVARLCPSKNPLKTTPGRDFKQVLRKETIS